MKKKPATIKKELPQAIEINGTQFTKGMQVILVMPDLRLKLDLQVRIVEVQNFGYCKVLDFMMRELDGCTVALKYDQHEDEVGELYGVFFCFCRKHNSYSPFRYRAILEGQTITATEQIPQPGTPFNKLTKMAFHECPLFR